MKVTDETVGDSKIFAPLVEQAFGNAVENVGADSVTLLGDNLYATKNIHKESKDRSIRLLKINSTVRGRKCKGFGNARSAYTISCQPSGILSDVQKGRLKNNGWGGSDMAGAG